MLATQVRRKSSGRLLSLALLGGITLSAGAGAVEAQSNTAQAAPRFTWLTLSGQWFCRSWSGNKGTGISSEDAWGVDMMAGRADAEDGDTTTHCTTNWHVDANGTLISDDSTWAPNPSGEWPELDDAAPVPLPHTQVVVVTRHALKVTQHRSNTSRTGSAGASNGGASYSSGAYGAWTPVPGHPSYGMSDFGGDPYSGSFGVCTWYAWYRHQSESALMKLGMADSWARNAPSHGLSVGSSPRVGATAVFQPGVQGAGGSGHVGHVEAILSGGWFIISEMNFTWNGGGWGRVDWRYVHVGSGVSFIY